MLAYLSHMLCHQNVGWGKGQDLWIRQMTAGLMSYFELLEESKGRRSSLTLRRSFRTLQFPMSVGGSLGIVGS